jgi:hypothetical protein
VQTDLFAGAVTLSTGTNEPTVGVMEASRRIGKAPSTVNRLVAVGRIRMVVVPGFPSRYVAADVDRVAAEMKGNMSPCA